MAVLSNNVQVPRKGNDLTVKMPVAGYTNFGGGSTAHTIYKGSLVVSDVSDTDGYVRAVPLTSSTNMASGDIFYGVAVERVDITSDVTGDGDKEVTVFANGIFGFAVGSLAQTDIGAAIYASDDQTITTTSTNNLWIGYLVDVDSDYAWVNIEPAFGRTNTAD